MKKIEVLEDQLINQIAAGEVVERPASVVKELVENAIDADSWQITVRIEEGGLKSIEVEDDGEGMSEEDIPQAFLRHATSKIRKESDLQSLHTLGFRGEALPSIASVSKIRIFSSEAGKIGASAYLEEGKILEQGPYPTSPGTRIIISDLFYNTPARRKFMKTSTTEFHKVHDLMVKQALSQSAASFTLQHNGKTYFKTPGSGRLDETIAALWGKEFLNCLIPVEWEGENIRISGYISRPEYKRANRQRQFFFVNERIVQNIMLSKAVDEGYRGLLISKEFPAVILFLELPQEDIDCNVHPQKMQVRFREEGKVFYVIKQALRSHLSRINHQAGFGNYAENLETDEKLPPAYFAPKPQLAFEAFPNHSMNLFSPSPGRENLKTDSISHFQPFPEVGPGLDSWEQDMQQMTPQGDIEPVQMIGDKEVLPFTIIGQAFHGYIVLEYQKKLWIVDQHAAHERVNYNIILEKLHQNQSVTQMLVIPQIIEVTPKEMDIYQEKKENLERLGFVLELLSEHELVLRGIPETCDKAWAGTPDTLEALNAVTAETSLEKMAARLACKKSVKDGQILTLEEMENIIAALLKAKDFRHCPHGRPTFIEISHEELEKKFKRI